jgi:hypothetical protein
MTFAIVVLSCVVFSAVCGLLAWRLDPSPAQGIWRRMWPAVFSGELAVTSAWMDENEATDEAAEFASESLNYVRG